MYILQIGLTINEANQYISDNHFYISHFDWTLITKVKRTYHNPTVLNVYVDDKISGIVCLG